MMWEPENIMVVSSYWQNHNDDWYWQEGEEKICYCDEYECKDCPRYGDDCDGEEEDEYDD